MENFTNQTIDSKELPKFEEVLFTSLDPKYFRIIVLNLILILFLFILAPILLSIGKPELFSNQVWRIVLVVLAVFFIFIVVFSVVAYKKKGFAFREHDVLFRSGTIATNTIVIPYNRVQHVALHEGFFSRYFGLATVEIFTAGGSSSTIKIPGIQKAQAENIKQLLMGKTQKEL